MEYDLSRVVRQTRCRRITCKSACHRLHSRMLPFKWDLNVYRGCSHECVYCYALYSHRYLDEGRADGMFFDEIFVKTNIAEALERQLSRPNWMRETVNLGGVSDSYQKLEESCRIMPDVWRLLIRYKTPAVISTKSDLILRDLDLIAELSRVTYVGVAATITTANEPMRRLIEPNAVPSARRFNMLREFRQNTNAVIGVHSMPMIPFLTDSRANVEALFDGAADIGAHYLLPGRLNLRGPTRGAFMGFIGREFPHLGGDIAKIYKDKSVADAYKKKLYAMIGEVSRSRGVRCGCAAPPSVSQPTLFDE